MAGEGLASWLLRLSKLRGCGGRGGRGRCNHRKPNKTLEACLPGAGVVGPWHQDRPELGTSLFTFHTFPPDASQSVPSGCIFSTQSHLCEQAGTQKGRRAGADRAWQRPPPSTLAARFGMLETDAQSVSSLPGQAHTRLGTQQRDKVAAPASAPGLCPARYYLRVFLEGLLPSKTSWAALCGDSGFLHCT